MKIQMYVQIAVRIGFVFLVLWAKRQEKFQLEKQKLLQKGLRGENCKILFFEYFPQ